jgi:predicted transcriptional regulator
MTKALWPYVFGKELGEQRLLIDDLSKRILETPVAPLVEWVDQAACSVKESSTPLEALQQIGSIQLGVMLVVGRGRGFTGVITQTPLYKAVVAAQNDARVKNLCTLRKNIVDINIQDSVKSALISFHRHKFKRLFVFDSDEMTKLGVLSRDRLMRWLIEQLIMESEIRA